VVPLHESVTENDIHMTSSSSPFLQVLVSTDIDFRAAYRPSAHIRTHISKEGLEIYYSLSIDIFKLTESTLSIQVMNRRSAPATMVSESLRSPNAIPPRTSSTGLSNGFLSPTKPVLRPVPEADWIAQGRKLHTTTTASSPPGADPPRTIGNDVKHMNGSTWSAAKEKILYGPYDYMFNHPGKDVRKQLIAAFNSWLKVPEESLRVITKVVGMLHTASLL